MKLMRCHTSGSGGASPPRTRVISTILCITMSSRSSQNVRDSAATMSKMHRWYADEHGLRNSWTRTSQFSTSSVDADSRRRIHCGSDNGCMQPPVMITTPAAGAVRHGSCKQPLATAADQECLPWWHQCSRVRTGQRAVTNGRRMTRLTNVSAPACYHKLRHLLHFNVLLLLLLLLYLLSNRQPHGGIAIGTLLETYHLSK